MRFLIDECLHESLEAVAHRAGFEATHVNHLGLTGTPDWELAERVVEDEFTFVTNNRLDFLKLFGGVELHAGVIIIVPNVVPELQRARFRAALQLAEGDDLVNTIVEVTLKSAACSAFVTIGRPAKAPLSSSWRMPLRLAVLAQ